MKQIEMEAKPRLARKKNEVGRLRLQNMVPAVLYGRGEETLSLELTGKQVQSALQTPSLLNTLIKLSIPDANPPRQETVMIKGVQRHPVTSQIMHLDFVKIALDRPLESRIPVLLTGTAPGVKEGGILEVVHREVAIRCLPALIPENITLDVSGLKIGDAITVAQLPVKEGIAILVDPHEPVVHVVAPKLEEEKPAAVEGAAAAAAPEQAKEPEVIGEKEREERRLAKTKQEEKK